MISLISKRSSHFARCSQLGILCCPPDLFHRLWCCCA